MRSCCVGSGSTSCATQQADPATWPDAKAQLAAVFKTKTRDEWCELLEDTDTCFAPVLTLGEAPQPSAQRRRARRS